MSTALLQLQSVTRLRAAADPAVSGAAAKAYLWLGETLDAEEFRAVKVRSLALTLRFELQTTARALRRLVSAGYIERGAKVARTWTYRLSFPER